MSVRSEKTVAPSPSEAMAAAITEAQPADANLAEGAAFATAQPENPLNRSVVVSIRASLNELCLQKQKGTWQPSAEAMRAILQQKKYTGLEGSAEQQGDLKVCTLLSHNGHALSIGVASCVLTSCAMPPPLAVGGPPQDERLARQVDVPVLARCVSTPRRSGSLPHTPTPPPPYALRLPTCVAFPTVGRCPHHRRRRQDLLVHRRGVLDHRPPALRVQRQQGAPG